MKTWKRENYTIKEIEFNYDLHAFEVIVQGKVKHTIYPDSLDSMKGTIEALNNGEEVEGWEDGLGNTIRIED